MMDSSRMENITEKALKHVAMDRITMVNFKLECKTDMAKRLTRMDQNIKGSLKITFIMEKAFL
jgi:hypothetical protein